MENEQHRRSIKASRIGNVGGGGGGREFNGAHTYRVENGICSTVPTCKWQQNFYPQKHLNLKGLKVTFIQQMGDL